MVCALRNTPCSRPAYQGPAWKAPLFLRHNLNTWLCTSSVALYHSCVLCWNPDPYSGNFFFPLSFPLFDISLKLTQREVSNNSKRTSFMNMLLSGDLDELIELLISSIMIFILTALNFIKLQQLFSFITECFVIYSIQKKQKK